jgi:hypothetical protein
MEKIKMMGQMVQIQSYVDQNVQTVGNFFNPTHQIEQSITHHTDKIDIQGTGIILLVALVVLYLGVRK